MKVTVVGSGSMWNKYNSASYLVDNNIAVDFPNGMCKYLFRQGIDPRKIEHVLITHFHGDHYFDLPFYFILKSKSDDKKVNIYCSKEGKAKNYKLLKLAFPNSAREIKDTLNLNYENRNDFAIDNYVISKHKVSHGKMPAYGYIFSKDNLKVGFTGDTTLCETVEYMASICNYLFCDCMFIKGTTKHMGIDMIKNLSTKYPNCKFVVSHMEENAREELKNLALENVIVPEDGIVIDIKG